MMTKLYLLNAKQANANPNPSHIVTLIMTLPLTMVTLWNSRPTPKILWKQKFCCNWQIFLSMENCGTVCSKDKKGKKV